MKYILSVVIISCLFFSACQKEYAPGGVTIIPGTLPTAAGIFKAKIDSVQWEATTVKQAQRESGVIVIAGISNGKSLILRVADSGVHNYTFETQSLSNVGAWSDSTVGPNAFATNQWSVDGNYGELNITAIDMVKKTMSGTFNMKVYRQFDNMQRTITEGLFSNIPFATQPPAPAATDTFRVKIDGVAFNYNLLSGIKAFGMISISAAKSPAPAVGITLPDNVTPGTYSFDIIDYVGQYNPSINTFLAADTGKVTILEHSVIAKRIRGNFHFLANAPFTHIPPSAQLTEGYFSVKYQ